MALTSIIAHQIFRTSPSDQVSARLRDQAFATSGKLEDLAYELKSQFIRKGGKSYGRFSSDLGEAPLPAWLQSFRQERMGLVNFTHKAVQHLQQLLDSTSSLFDSYVFFVQEIIEAGEYLYVFIVEHESGIYLDGDLQPGDSQFLDTTNFTLAAKINCSEWDSGESLTYLTLMRSRSDKDYAEAFAKFIGFADKYDVRADTREFLDAVENFTQTLEEPVARLTRTRVADYCLEQNKAGRSVSLADLSTSLAAETQGFEPERFVRFVAQDKPEIKSEFIPHAGQVRSYVRISGRNDSLSMSFASECLGREIEYDAERDLLMIKNLPSSLKKQLITHLKQQNKGS